jgi:hypothetical protein
MSAQPCDGEPRDGHEHQGEPQEYVRICPRKHERRGWLCPACARLLGARGPAAVTCGECPDDDPRPGALIPAAEWDAVLAAPVVREGGGN